jgi:hypothetical protein
MSDSFLIGPDSAELFSGPRVVTVKDFAAIRLSAGTHTLTLTAERPVLLTITPSEEASRGEH